MKKKIYLFFLTIYLLGILITPINAQIDDSKDYLQAFNADTDDRWASDLMKSQFEPGFFQSYTEQVWFNDTKGYESVVGVGNSKFLANLWNIEISNDTKQEYWYLFQYEIVNENYTEVLYTLEFQGDNFYEYLKWWINATYGSSKYSFDIPGAEESFSLFVGEDWMTAPIYTVISKVGDYLSYYFSMEYTDEIFQWFRNKDDENIKHLLQYSIGVIGDNVTFNPITIIRTMWDYQELEKSATPQASSDPIKLIAAAPKSSSSINSTSIEDVENFASQYSINLASGIIPSDHIVDGMTIEDEKNLIPGYSPFLISFAGIIAIFFVRRKYKN